MLGKNNRRKWTPQRHGYTLNKYTVTLIKKKEGYSESIPLFLMNHRTMPKFQYGEYGTG